MEPHLKEDLIHDEDGGIGQYYSESTDEQLVPLSHAQVRKDKAWRKKYLKSKHKVPPNLGRSARARKRIYYWYWRRPDPPKFTFTETYSKPFTDFLDWWMKNFTGHNTMDLNNYPKLKEATLSIAHDNGCISRVETEEDVIERIEAVLPASFTPEQLQQAEAHLASLSNEQFIDVTIGENATAESEDPTEKLVNDMLDEISSSMFEG